MILWHFCHRNVSILISKWGQFWLQNEPKMSPFLGFIFIEKCWRPLRKTGFLTYFWVRKDVPKWCQKSSFLVLKINIFGPPKTVISWRCRVRHFRKWCVFRSQNIFLSRKIKIIFEPQKSFSSRKLNFRSKKKFHFGPKIGPKIKNRPEKKIEISFRPGKQNSKIINFEPKMSLKSTKMVHFRPILA